MNDGFRLKAHNQNAFSRQKNGTILYIYDTQFMSFLLFLLQK